MPKKAADKIKLGKPSEVVYRTIKSPKFVKAHCYVDFTDSDCLLSFP